MHLFFKTLNRNRNLDTKIKSKERKKERNKFMDYFYIYLYFSSFLCCGRRANLVFSKITEKIVDKRTKLLLLRCLQMKFDDSDVSED